MRRRIQAVPAPATPAGFAISATMTAATSAPPPCAAATQGGGGTAGTPSLQVSGITVQQDSLCSWLLFVGSAPPGSVDFAATWDSMVGGDAVFDTTLGSAAVFRAINPITGVTFFATLSTGEVLISEGHDCSY